MEVTGFRYTPSAEVLLTGQEVGLLMLQSASHYDLTCIKACLPGGFLFGIKNHVEWGGDQVPVSIDMHKAGILSKILEQPTHSRCSELTALYHELRRKFWDLQVQLNAEYDRLNPKPQQNSDGGQSVQDPASSTQDSEAAAQRKAEL